MIDEEQWKRWRLILGSCVQESLEDFTGNRLLLNSAEKIMDEALAAIYDKTEPEQQGSAGQGKGGAPRSAGNGPSFPTVANWLADIRSYFPEDVVAIIQTDAIERKGLKQLLYEPELLKNLQPSIELVATLISLKGKIPEKTKGTAREVVRAIVEEINKRLANDLRKAVRGALNRKKHSPLPNVASIDWQYTIRRNLKNYNTEYRKIIPERFFFFERKREAHNWQIILDMDQSGSMADSIIYGSIAGSIFAEIAALKTKIVAFDTEVIDLSEQYGNDPVEMLFGLQLGGGTDINKSVAYCRQFITEPAKTLFILLSDLYEGGNQAALVRRLTEMHEAKVKVLCLLALADNGVPIYNEALARRISQIGIPCFACTPKLLPELLEGVLKGQDLQALAEALKAKGKER